MYLIPAVPNDYPPGCFEIFVVLDRRNLKRMIQNDPAIFSFLDMPIPWRHMRPTRFHVCFPPIKTLQEVVRLMREDRGADALRLLVSGYRVLPSDGMPMMDITDVKVH